MRDRLRLNTESSQLQVLRELKGKERQYKVSKQWGQSRTSATHGDWLQIRHYGRTCSWPSVCVVDVPKLL